MLFIKNRFDRTLLKLAIVVAVMIAAVALPGAQNAHAAITSLPGLPYIGTDDWVQTAAVSDDGSTLYLGGWFTRVFQITQGVGRYEASDGTVVQGWLPSMNGPDGQGLVVISDGANGWYVGGSFSAIGGEAVNNLAHIYASGTVDTSFNANPNGVVYSLVLDGGTLYAGGDFTTVNGGTTRRYLAAFDAADGTVTSFDANIGSSLGNNVYQLLLDNTTLYAGGTFASVNGGTTRNNLAAFDTSNGTATAFDPNMNNPVQALVLDGSTLYAGGQFTTVNGGTTRRYVAGLSTADGTVTSFDANIGSGISNFVHALVLDGTTLYVGGNFTSVNGGTTRNRLAAFSTADASVTSFDPNANASIHALVLDGTTLYAGGTFTTVNGGTTRNGAAAFSTINGTATAFNPDLGRGATAAAGTARSILLDGGDILIAGSMASSNPLDRNRIVAIDLASGTITSFAPDVDNDAVLYLVLDNDTLYAGGGFTTVENGTTRNHLAAFDTGTGAATSFNPNLNNNVYGMFLDGSVLYVGGEFTAVNGGTTRNFAAAFDTSTGVATSFDPDLDGIVQSVVGDGSTIYLGGWFTAANNGGATRNYVAGVDPSTGVVTSFDPDMDGVVYYLLLDSDTLYVGGDFTAANSGGATRNGLAAFNTSTSTATSFDPNLNAVVESLLLLDGNIYAGGQFTTVNGGTTRNFAAAFDTSTGVATSFDPDLDGDVLFMVTDGSALYAEGGFESALSASFPSTYFAAFGTPSVNLPAVAATTPRHHYIPSETDNAPRLAYTPSSGSGSSNDDNNDSSASSTPTSTPASTPSSTDERAALQAQINALLAQIAALQAKLGLQPPAASPAFTRDLSLGSLGPDVLALQKYLNAKGFLVSSSGPGSPGQETEKFGALTKAALAKFQAANNISPAAGYFGPMTRAFVNSLAGQGQ